MSGAGHHEARKLTERRQTLDRERADVVLELQRQNSDGARAATYAASDLTREQLLSRLQSQQ